MSIASETKHDSSCTSLDRTPLEIVRLVWVGALALGGAIAPFLKSWHKMNARRGDAGADVFGEKISRREFCHSYKSNQDSKRLSFAVVRLG